MKFVLNHNRRIIKYVKVDLLKNYPFTKRVKDLCKPIKFEASAMDKNSHQKSFNYIPN